MKTYLKLSFSSEGEKPSTIVDRLMNLGFRPTPGKYDLVYDWDKEANIKDIIWFGDKIHSTVKGAQCSFELETV
jgi:hypothetical protein